MDICGPKLARNNNTRRKCPKRPRQLTQNQVRRLILLNRFAKLVEQATQQPLSEGILLSLLDSSGISSSTRFNQQPAIQQCVGNNSFNYNNSLALIEPSRQPNNSSTWQLFNKNPNFLESGLFQVKK